MSSSLDLDVIYNDINNLLKDVCNFLTNQVKNGGIAINDQKEAENLIMRSHKQIDVIVTIPTIIKDHTDTEMAMQMHYPYLQMQKNTIAAATTTIPTYSSCSEYIDSDISHYYQSNMDEESYDEIVDESNQSETVRNVVLPSLQDRTNCCPYGDLSLCDIELESNTIKYGPLYRKERYFILEQKKKFYVCLIEYWLLIYCTNKRDIKPIQILNITNCQAQIVEQTKEFAFVLLGGKKSYEFITRTNKEMLQWIDAINLKKNKYLAMARHLPEIPSSELKKTNKNDHDHNDGNTELDCDLYENLDDLNVVHQNTVQVEENTYDPVQTEHEIIEDDIYDVLKVSEVNNITDIAAAATTAATTNVDEIYDEFKLNISSKANNANKIFNIIQQMEVSLNFKGAKY